VAAASKDPNELNVDFDYGDEEVLDYCHEGEGKAAPVVGYAGDDVNELDIDDL
jgi:hypothetical protein